MSSSPACALPELHNAALPIVDFANTEEAPQVLYKACKEFGFFYLVNHGVPQSLIDEMLSQSKVFARNSQPSRSVLNLFHPFIVISFSFLLSFISLHATQIPTPSFPPLPSSLTDQSQAFFSLPLSAKKKLSASHNQINRGYTGFEEETLDPVLQKGKGDTKEGYYIGREVPAESEEAKLFPLHGPNVWPSPEELPQWRGMERGRRRGRGGARSRKWEQKMQEVEGESVATHSYFFHSYRQLPFRNVGRKN